MSPEYAMEGLFSEKSDVFSFGVLLLEILSGKRNSIFSDDEQSLSLLEYVSFHTKNTEPRVMWGIIFLLLQTLVIFNPHHGIF